ncbi:TIGR03560 family F420-dependent LLM class oxidoreductase [Nakamurella sp. YIM 132087]|uniref:TIGR03560 family F420-dependent LLM class oxidoreductase n=1 Tax=Nakamurella alba TaxID=2665158 RepID=A0A7K1FJ45_9ACTN|nr:LLM class F420-dependent oxidoreductase [Nakamurella alba]MTD12914.1 TIGR03560 family F420-dependent LLM class oxidoreductase [Nakamurella alba]
MLLGLQVPSFTWPDAPAATGPTFKRIAVEAEQAGVASLWVMDHFFQISMVGPAEDDMLEGWSALAFAAAATERIKLGTMVTGVTYRHPGVLIKTATTLDVLSGGRAYFGIGAAWNEEEHLGLGVPYPPLKERFERLTETLQLAHQMWKDDDSPFQGTHYQLQRPLNHPQSVSRPHPPILVGGTGEKKTLRLVGQYADACNIFEMDLPGITHKLEVLQSHAADVGRDYAAIEKTTLGTLALSKDGADGTQTVQQAVDRFGRLAEIGIDHALVNMPAVAVPGTFDLVAEVAAQIAPIVPAGR